MVKQIGWGFSKLKERKKTQQLENNTFYMQKTLPQTFTVHYSSVTEESFVDETRV